jgi:hypothetical protein
MRGNPIYCFAEKTIQETGHVCRLILKSFVC